MISELIMMCWTTFEPNYDENRVPAYSLTDPLTFKDGQQVKKASDWPERRAEILKLFETEVYGQTPHQHLPVEIIEVDEMPSALDGLATQEQVILRFGHKSTDINVLIYRPNNVDHSVPAFLGLNFNGNHTVHSDSNIRVTKSWVPNNGNLGVEHNIASESGRGLVASRWAVETIIKRGYSLVTVYYGDLDPDFDDGFKNGIHPLFDENDQPRRRDSWGSIGAWSWGLSRVLDYLEMHNSINATKVAVMGHSRLGKTSLWAGAQDSRFSMVISNNSGCGGAALSRRRFGETVARINNSFPHWFCQNFNRYSDNEDKLPIDQHELLTLIAPRPVYIASATDDLWADPKGEFLAAKYADPVYRLLGTEGIPTDQAPEIDQSIMGQIGYHIRSGGHDVTLYDWKCYLDFADRHLY